MARPLGRVPEREVAELAASRSHGETSAGEGGQQQADRARQFQIAGEDDEEEDAELAAAIAESKQTAEQEAKARAGAGDGAGPSTSQRAASESKGGDDLADGVAAALAKLRKG